MLAEAEEARKQKWAQLEVGAKVKGVVRRITDFGAFVDIGGIDGLVHVTDVAWGRVKHPSDVLSIGQEVEVLIRDVDVERQRVSLGYKQLQPKPWTMADQKYPVGTIVEGKVVRIVPFGAFVALEPTIDGLIHISQVGVKRIVKVEDEINVGDIVRCKVLDVNPEAKRISLSRREVILEENPEIAEELAKEKAERERIAAERAEQRAAASESPASRSRTVPSAASVRSAVSARNAVSAVSVRAVRMRITICRRFSLQRHPLRICLLASPQATTKKSKFNHHKISTTGLFFMGGPGFLYISKEGKMAVRQNPVKQAGLRPFHKPVDGAVRSMCSQSGPSCK